MFSFFVSCDSEQWWTWKIMKEEIVENWKVLFVSLPVSKRAERYKWIELNPSKFKSNFHVRTRNARNFDETKKGRLKCFQALNKRRICYWRVRCEMMSPLTPLIDWLRLSCSLNKQLWVSFLVHWFITKLINFPFRNTLLFRGKVSQ